MNDFHQTNPSTLRPALRNGGRTGILIRGFRTEVAAYTCKSAQSRTPRPGPHCTSAGEPSMCQLYVQTDPSLYEFRARSVRLHGMLTSIRLENQFYCRRSSSAWPGRNPACLHIRLAYARRPRHADLHALVSARAVSLRNPEDLPLQDWQPYSRRLLRAQVHLRRRAAPGRPSRRELNLSPQRRRDSFQYPLEGCAEETQRKPNNLMGRMKASRL